MTITSPDTKTLQRWVKNLLQLLLLLAIFWFVSQSLTEQFRQIEDEPLDVDVALLVLALVGMVAGYGVVPYGSWVALNDLGHRYPRAQIYRIYYLSNIAKYLPGSIWGQIGRAYLYQQAGIPALTGVVAVIWEMILMLSAGGLCALLSLRMVREYIPDILVAAALVLAFLLLLLMLLLFRLPTLRREVSRLPLPRRLRDLMTNDGLWLTLPQAIRIGGIYMVAWFTIGLSLNVLVAAFVDFDPAWIPELIGLYMLGWWFGYVVFFAPGGIGVRDGILILGLAVILNDPLPAVIAVVARIIWIVTEVFWAALFSAIGVYRHRQSQPR